MSKKNQKDKITFVSAADSNYYPLLREWIHSVRAFKESKNIDICILNTGMSAEQVESLKPLVTKVLDIDWPFPVPEKKIQGREFLKACLIRPFLPNILPEYDVYFWIDSDTWVQRWDGAAMFLKGASEGKIALTGQVDRGYPRAARIKWLWRWPRKVAGFYFSNVRPAFGFGAAKQLMTRHVLLAGAFALRRDAPHWKRWQELVQVAARRGNVFTAEQTALGILCHLENYEYELLPAWTHWLCEFKPLWDEETGKFVEPFLPREELGILHLSGVDEMRAHRGVGADFKTTRGNTVHLSYRYPHFDGERGVEVKNDLPDANEVPRGELRIAGKTPV